MHFKNENRKEKNKTDISLFCTPSEEKVIYRSIKINFSLEPQQNQQRGVNQNPTLFLQVSITLGTYNAWCLKKGICQVRFDH